MTLSDVAVLPRLLGTLFYYPPSSEEAQAMISQLAQVPDLFPWSERQLVADVCHTLAATVMKADSTENKNLLTETYTMLFERQGDLPAPPWGSVYLDTENMLFADSTDAYCRFLEEHGVELNTSPHEPADQFGLMILTLGLLMESDNDEAVMELMAVHLLPWAYRYLDRVTEADNSDFYAPLAKLAVQLLQEVQSAYDITPQPLTLFL